MILERVKSYPILTVSDIEGFVKFGGMIEMITKNSRVAFVIDLKTSKENYIDISSDLLALATVIK